LLIDHMKAALTHIEAHPIQESLTSKEASGFHH
jgi:glutamate decarboxylase